MWRAQIRRPSSPVCRPSEADAVGLLLTDHTGEFPTDEVGIWIPMDNVAFISMRPLPADE